MKAHTNMKVFVGKRKFRSIIDLNAVYILEYIK